MVETTSRIASSSSTTRIFSVSTVSRLPVVIIREVTPVLGQPCPFRKQHVSVRINGFLSKHAPMRSALYANTGICALGRRPGDDVSCRQIRVYLPLCSLKRPRVSFSLCCLRCSIGTIALVIFVFGFADGLRLPERRSPRSSCCHSIFSQSL